MGHNIDKIRFIHITKTAGSVVRLFSKEKKLNWLAYFQGKKKHEFISLERNPKYHEYDWFLISRNPFTRIVSTVNWSYLRYKQGNKNKHVKILANLFKKNEKSDLITILNMYIKEGIHNLDPKGGHFTPQYKYLNPDLNIEILRFEHLHDDFSKFMKKYNSHLKFPRKLHNKSKYVFTLMDIDQDNIELIKTFYKNDFDKFKYSLDFPTTSK